MKVITVAHQKGGVGKTTLALNLSFLFKDTLKVGILDTDLQGSVVGLGELLEGITLLPQEVLTTGNVPDLDILIIDTPPYLTDQLSTSVRKRLAHQLTKPLRFQIQVDLMQVLSQ